MQAIWLNLYERFLRWRIDVKTRLLYRLLGVRSPSLVALGKQPPPPPLSQSDMDEISRRVAANALERERQWRKQVASYPLHIQRAIHEWEQAENQARAMYRLANAMHWRHMDDPDNETPYDHMLWVVYRDTANEMDNETNARAELMHSAIDEWEERNAIR